MEGFNISGIPPQDKTETQCLLEQIALELTSINNCLMHLFLMQSFLLFPLEGEPRKKIWEALREISMLHRESFVFGSCRAEFIKMVAQDTLKSFLRPSEAENNPEPGNKV